MFDRSAEEILGLVSKACAARDEGLLAVAVRVADAIERGAFAAAGLPHGSSWLRAYTETSGAEARRVVSLGRLLACHRSTREAVEAGRLSIARAGVLAAAVTDARRAAYRDDEELLLGLASDVHRVEDFEVVVANWCALLDQEIAPGVDHPQRLYLQHRFDGGASVRGELNARTTEALRAGLHAFDTGPDPVDGPLPVRSLAERHADALGDLAGYAADHVCGSGHEGSGEPEEESGQAGGGPDASQPQADDVKDDIPQDTDTAKPRPVASAVGDPASRSSRTTNLVIDLPSLAGRARTDLDGIVATLDGRPLAAWAARELLCDTWIAAVVTGADGAVIDATNRTADFTDTQRRLIAVRDQGCVFPACDAPPSWCDVHHLHWRSNGGGRALENGALLCRRHHTLLHRVDRDDRRWTLHRSPDGTRWHATSPAGTTWTGRPGREPPDHRAAPAA